MISWGCYMDFSTGAFQRGQRPWPMAETYLTTKANGQKGDTRERRSRRWRRGRRGFLRARAGGLEAVTFALRGPVGDLVIHR
jgi:hypothetical protein